ncbi:MAG: hypothetical protein HQ553_06815 [Chloroflexi bacterium]|nr:hypothetical protein [Chloroflexota bacterium]
MKVYYCTQCEKRVVVPKEAKGALCPQCDRPMILDKPKSRRRGISPFLVIGLIVAILMSGGIWVYFDVVDFDDTQTKETVIDIKSQPRASDVTPRIFDLWQLNSDDSVRRVIVLTDTAAEDLQVRVWAPSLRSGDNILSLETIGGELIDQSTHEDEYRGNMYLETVYTLLAEDDQYGYNMLIDHPPHLHTITPATKYDSNQAFA